MRHADIAVLLGTGGADMVRAVYTAGKPAYGVGPGNVPAIIERTADVAKAVHDVVDAKTFDAGVLCSSENSVIVDRPIARSPASFVRASQRSVRISARRGNSECSSPT
jgi:acyl-CoA reductase-like NAD-dependent aldehyde dehydrogenase